MTLYHSLLRPLLFRLPPETAHELALHSLSIAPGAIQRLIANRASDDWVGDIERFGLSFKNPIGLAAGFDKNGIALNALSALGFGFIEAGTVTFHPQPGNEKPRLFRLTEDKALINRAGFNNDGAAAFVARVLNNRPSCVLGVSIGKSKIAPLEEAVLDYLKSFELIFPVADYVALNVSSPNTPGLRDLQQADRLDELLSALQKRNRELAERSKPKPLLVKLSPDLHHDDLLSIVEVIARNDVAGIIATNTSVSRDNLHTARERVLSYGHGGLSGAPLRPQSNRVIARLFQLTEGRIPLVGVGGIFNAQDAWEKICAGASLLQLYTGFIYEGPGIVRSINRGLQELLRIHRFTSIDEAVGSRATDLSK